MRHLLRGRLEDGHRRAVEEAERFDRTMENAGCIAHRLGPVDAVSFEDVSARTAADARDALDALRSFGHIPSALSTGPNFQGPVGEVYRLAGRTGEAIDRLSHTVARCDAFTYPFDHTWAAYHLGLARETAGDQPGACDAFAIVTSRWGNDSVTGRAARARQAALHCPPRPHTDDSRPIP
jgi:hypothetical protein